LSEKKSTIYIGPAGWSYPDWNGIIYPTKKPKGFSELEYIAKYFNVVEVNTSFYRIPAKKTVEKWAGIKDVNPDFRFLVKLWQNFTHRYPYSDKESILNFIDACSPLSPNMLAGLLMQFPWRFKYNTQNVEYLEYLMRAFKQLDICVEFRHNSWNNQHVLHLFKKHNITFVNIDQPAVSNSLCLTNHISSNMTYIRFHGRNSEEWFNEQGGRDSRYNYLYKKNELNQWLPFIKNENVSEKKFIIFNNHFRGQAVINAFQMTHMLFQTKPKAPAILVRSVPGLEKIVEQDDIGETLPLF
jgi:uncharacterized protein YecE (DUF72 family)